MASARAIERVEVIVGMEVHVQLATRTKVFSRAPNPAGACAPAGADGDFAGAAPNTLIDEVVLGLPGALPVLNESAAEMAARVGVALGCEIAPVTRWDRKSYFYPDLPKGYQISQYDLPIASGGWLDLPAPDAKGEPDWSRPGRRVGIVRAHLEEDAGKLLHEAPGGHAIDGTLADYNRAGAPLLEIVTAPDLTGAAEAVLFAKTLRTLLRFLGVTRGVMQQGHLRFEPNINCRLVLSDGREVRTPIVEVKNLNSFRAVHDAVAFEAREQPGRWAADGREHGPGSKVTRGWDDVLGRTVVQREKEDAHDYRYFPDPDLPPMTFARARVAALRAQTPELPAARAARYTREFGLGAKEAEALVEERAVCEYYEGVAAGLAGLGVSPGRAGKVAANAVLGVLQRLANERGVLASELGVSPADLARAAHLREAGEINNQGADALVGALAGSPATTGDVRALAQRLGLLVVRDEAALAGWVDEAIAANAQAADDVRAGKAAAMGRLIGDVMKRAGGRADAAAAREALARRLARP